MKDSVAFADIQDQLIDLDTARATLAATEPFQEHIYSTGTGITFQFGMDWADPEETDQPTDVFMTVPGGGKYQLTKLAALQAGAFAGIPRGYQEKLMQAPSIHASQVNYWYGAGLGEKDFKVLWHPQEGEACPLIRAVARGSVQPFSNVEMFDAVLRGLDKVYGEEVSAEAMVDYKFHHDIEGTHVRFVLPSTARVINGTRVEGDDTWCAGVQFTNSLIGLSHPGTSLSAYLFRYWCTNGATDTLMSSKLKRRSVGSPGDAYGWAEHSVEEVLGGLESAFDSVQQLTQIPVAGDVNLILADLFSQGQIPVTEQRRIIALTAELDGDLTLYDLQNAVTLAANDTTLSPRTVQRILELGGHIAHAATDRCSGQYEDGCRRLLPDGWLQQAELEAAKQEAAASVQGPWDILSA